jgi:Tfp pilus assembly protein PilF
MRCYLAVPPLVVALLLALAFAAQAAPFTPARDSDVVERLPLASDPSVRRVESLRKQLAARPGDAALRVDIAQRYFDLAMAQGDPRFVGYASAAIAPLAANPGDNADYWLVRGLIQQFSHDFEGALTSLAKASQLDPRSPAALSWRAAIFMVQARYTEALAECERLAPLAEPLLGAGCSAYARSMTGQLQPALQDLGNAVKAAPQAAPPLLLWQYTRLAEMAWRLQRHALAESHFKNALALGITDQFLLGAYADFLLAQQRPGEVLTLLAGWERSDILLLRLALAGRATGDARTGEWTAQLRDRFQAAAQRGDRLHEQEAARFELDLERNGAKALELAARNYEVQKEPRDAEILMRAALAAGQAKAAQAALDWLRSSGYQDPMLSQLANQLAAQGASR